MDISFELYKVFYYVATTLSFSQASRQLYISQSAVSQSIKSLEQKLGHPLFLRNTKKVTLTPEGEALLRHVEPAVNLLYEGENQLLNSPSVEAPLRIGASDTICRYFLVPYFQRFHREYPNIRIKVTNATSGGCVSLLQNNKVDFIVVNAPNAHLLRSGRKKDHLIPACGISHSYAGKIQHHQRIFPTAFCPPRPFPDSRGRAVQQ